MISTRKISLINIWKIKMVNLSDEQAESGSWDTEEEVTKIKSILVTVNVKSTDENDNKFKMEFSSKISESDREIAEMQDEERDLFDRDSRTLRTSHDIVFYCLLTIVILLPCILLSYIFVHKK
jgi:hypothetical protein